MSTATIASTIDLTRTTSVETGSGSLLESRTAAAPTTPAAPSTHRRALLTWLAVYPTITLVQELVGKSIAPMPLPMRTLLVTALVVPVVSYLVLPRLAKAERHLARKLHEHETGRRDAA